MPESANLKTAHPKTAPSKTASSSSATVQVPSSASEVTVGPPITAAPVKAPTPKPAPFSTGSPLLDSFISSSVEKPVYIPNPHITGDRFGSRQGPSFRNVTLNGPAVKPSRVRFDSEDFKRAGIASAAVPIKKSSKSIQLKSQPPGSSPEQPSQNGKKPHQPNGQSNTNSQTAADTQLTAAQKADKREVRSQAQSSKTSSKPQKSEKTARARSQKPPQSATQQQPAVKKSAAKKSAKPVSAKTRQRPQSGTTGAQGNAPVSRQNGVRPPVAPNTANPAMTPAPGRVYGGSDYKALQSRAAAGGLVDLEDTLLFGGAEDKSSSLSIGNAPPGVDSNPMAVLEYLITLPSDFTLTKPEGNRAILDDFSWLERPAFLPTQAVIDARNFQVVEQPSPQTQAVQPRNEQAARSESEELKALTQKIDQLHQRIEYLSKRLASLDAEPSVDTPTMSAAALFDSADVNHTLPRAASLFQGP